AEPPVRVVAEPPPVAEAGAGRARGRAGAGAVEDEAARVGDAGHRGAARPPGAAAGARAGRRAEEPLARAVTVAGAEPEGARARLDPEAGREQEVVRVVPEREEAELAERLAVPQLGVPAVDVIPRLHLRPRRVGAEREAEVEQELRHLILAEARDDD